MKGLVFALLLTGCAFLTGCASPALTVANIAVNSGSLIATGKTIGDHMLSALSAMDCRLFRIIDNKSPCQEISPDGNVEIVYMDGGDAEAVKVSETAKITMAVSYKSQETVAYTGPFRNACLTRNQWRRAVRTHSRWELRKLPPRCKPGQEWWHKVLVALDIEKPRREPAAADRDAARKAESRASAAGSVQVAPTGAVQDDGELEAAIPENPAGADFAVEAEAPEAPEAPEASSAADPGVGEPAVAPLFTRNRAQAAAGEEGGVEIASLVDGPAARAAPEEDAPGEEYSYRLGPGDKLRVTVYGEEDLSGEFEVGSAGEVSLPLIGAVRVADLTLRGFVSLAELRLREGYLKHPRVSVEVINYRPVYVLGEVNNPGVYEYVNHMTVLQAVVLAGGYTYRANEDKVKIVRRTHASGAKKKEGNFTKLLPGDIVRIPERFF